MDGEQLLKYRGDLERILCVCVRLRCKQAYTLACSLLEHTLRSLSLIYPTEYRSTSGGFETDLPIRVNTHTHTHTHTLAIFHKTKQCLISNLRD